MKLLTTWEVIKKEFPASESFKLIDQLDRSISSVSLNIAEGSGKSSKKDFAHYIDNSKGSLMESKNSLQIAKIKGYLNSGIFDDLDLLITELYFKLIGFRKALLRGAQNSGNSGNSSQNAGRSSTSNISDDSSTSRASRKRSDQPGFTLVEIMVVVAIMGILMAGAIPTFNSYNKSQVLAQAVRSVRSDLRTVQNFSISGADGKVWGIHFTFLSRTYQFFKCTPGTPGSLINSRTEYRYDSNPTAYPDCTLSKAQDMSSTTRISSPDVDVAFESVGGEVYVNGAAAGSVTQIIVDYASGSSSPKLVCVSQTGGIKEEMTAPSCT